MGGLVNSKVRFGTLKPQADSVSTRRDDWQVHADHQPQPSSSVSDKVTLVIVDGQQRFTTCLLLAAALRDAARRGGIEAAADELDALLFPNSAGARQLTTSTD